MFADFLPTPGAECTPGFTFYMGLFENNSSAHKGPGICELSQNDNVINF